MHVVLRIDFCSCGTGYFLSEILICMRSLGLISVVDSLIESKTFIECLMLKESCALQWLRAWTLGPDCLDSKPASATYLAG